MSHLLLLLTPQSGCIQERKLRAYSRITDQAHVDAVRIAFYRWVSKMWGDQVVTSTPLRHPHMQLQQPILAEPTFAAPREQLQARAVKLTADAKSTIATVQEQSHKHAVASTAASQGRLEKKRKIQLQSIPE